MTRDSEADLKIALGANYDATVVDLILPGKDRLSLIEEIRAAEVKTPVIVLRAKRSTDDKVTGLRRGADDYLAKPFDLTELRARVERSCAAAVRRAKRSAANPAASFLNSTHPFARRHPRPRGGLERCTDRERRAH